jgi:hypothetical protein
MPTCWRRFNDGILSGIGSLVPGCFTGGAIGWLRSAAPWISVMLSRVFSNSIAGIVGSVANRAIAAQVELPLQAAWDVAEQALAEP